MILVYVNHLQTLCVTLLFTPPHPSSLSGIKNIRTYIPPPVNSWINKYHVTIIILTNTNIINK